jgi:hypothetical protein
MTRRRLSFVIWLGGSSAWIVFVLSSVDPLCLTRDMSHGCRGGLDWALFDYLDLVAIIFGVPLALYGLGVLVGRVIDR